MLSNWWIKSASKLIFCHWFKAWRIMGNKFVVKYSWYCTGDHRIIKFSVVCINPHVMIFSADCRVVDCPKWYRKNPKDCQGNNNIRWFINIIYAHSDTAGVSSLSIMFCILDIRKFLYSPDELYECSGTNS